jgi:hypothetical protein
VSFNSIHIALIYNYMKLFISNSLNIYTRVTLETSTHYICGDTLYSKEDVLVDYHPLDNVTDVLHLCIVPFYN